MHSQDFDVFNWANQMDEIKNNVTIELFLINKHYTPYKVRYSESLTNSVRSLFLLEAVNYVNQEADRGLEVHELEDATDGGPVIFRTDLAKVERAETLLHLIEHEYKDLPYFTEEEFGFKLIKGIIARFIYLDSQSGETKTFYIAKNISSSQFLKGKQSWELSGESFEALDADIAIRIPDRNEVAIIDGHIVIFDEAKFEKLFEYNRKLQGIADAKAKQLIDQYHLQLPEGLTLDQLLMDKKPLIKKLEAIDEFEMTPQQVLDYADEMSLELMADDHKNLIIMDTRDLTQFVNLLSEDYYISPLSGKRYEIKSKKLLDDPEGEPPRG
jgi:hypothetical protein